MFAYRMTYGSNLDLEDLCVDVHGNELSLETDIYPDYDIILCISTYSATAPLTAMAKKYNFRGATLHGVNEVILSSGLAVDYNDVSRDAEKLRLASPRPTASKSTSPSNRAALWSGSVPGGQRTRARGWTGCSHRGRMPPCAGGAGCAASRSPTACCTGGRPSW